MLAYVINIDSTTNGLSPQSAKRTHNIHVRRQITLIEIVVYLYVCVCVSVSSSSSFGLLFRDIDVKIFCVAIVAHQTFTTCTIYNLTGKKHLFRLQFRFEIVSIRTERERERERRGLFLPLLILFTSFSKLEFSWHINWWMKNVLIILIHICFDLPFSTNEKTNLLRCSLRTSTLYKCR